MFLVLNRGGYAEHVPGDSQRMEEIRKENEAAMGHIDSLTIGFHRCAVTGASQTMGGYPEIHPPVCEKVYAAMTQDLRAAQEEMKAALINREFSAEVLTLRF